MSLSFCLPIREYLHYVLEMDYIQTFITHLSRNTSSLQIILTRIIKINYCLVVICDLKTCLHSMKFRVFQFRVLFCNVWNQHFKKTSVHLPSISCICPCLHETLCEITTLFWRVSVLILNYHNIWLHFPGYASDEPSQHVTHQHRNLFSQKILEFFKTVLFICVIYKIGYFTQLILSQTIIHFLKYNLSF